MGKRLLAFMPTAECLGLAARIRPHWDEFRVGGAKLIVGVLEEWSRERPGAEAIVLVADVQDPARVRAALERFCAAGGRVTWFARARAAGVLKACAGLERVRMVTGPTLTDALETVYPLAPDDVDPDEDPTLRDYLRYKTTLFFMKLMDPAPLAEAIETVCGCQGAFDLKRAAPRDADSVRHFQETDFPYIEGHSPQVVALKQRVLALAQSGMSVLINGESGTGKEAVAFYLHEFSPRRAGPFVSLNCAGLDEHFLRSELFGHVKGSFTGAVSERKGLVEQAAEGTLFFDELADMPLSVQADLLRFLQTRRFRRMGSDREIVADVRIVAATQPVLREKLARGEFRADLFYRIAEVELLTPRLADVPDDIPRIIRYITYRHRARLARDEIVKETIEYFKAGDEILRRYAWPGNVRELARYVRRRLLLGDDVLTEIAQLDTPPASANGNGHGHVNGPGHGHHFRPIASDEDIEPAEDVMRRYIQHVYAQRGELTQQELAEKLDLSVNTLKKYLHS